MQPARNVVAFVLSSQRSGSTWLGYVLGSHPDSAFLGEYSRAWNIGGKVPCTTCAARGLAECEVLHGIEAVPVGAAFDWAFGRTGKQLLVDASKSVEWAARFVAEPAGADIRLIHLVRDPRGWFASQRRRLSVGDAEMIRFWHDENARLHEFVHASGRPHCTVFYDELAARPLSRLPNLVEFCGLPFDRSALEYWNVTHHGFAANGATSAILSKAEQPQRVAHFATGDDPFYARQDRSQFVDTRWREQLTPAQLEAIVDDADIAALLRSLGRRIEADGLTPTAEPRSILGRLKAVFATRS